MSGAPWVAFYPPSLGSAEVRIVALAWCSQELSTCYTMAMLRMLFSHQYTLPPYFLGVAGSAFRCAAVAAMFSLVVVKVRSCCSMAQLASDADSRWSTSASLASVTALSLVSLP
jgi:hypothetical protein